MATYIELWLYSSHILSRPLRYEKHIFGQRISDKSFLQSWLSIPHMGICVHVVIYEIWNLYSQHDFSNILLVVCGPFVDSLRFCRFPSYITFVYARICFWLSWKLPILKFRCESITSNAEMKNWMTKRIERIFICSFPTSFSHFHFVIRCSYWSMASFYPFRLVWFVELTCIVYSYATVDCATSEAQRRR